MSTVTVVATVEAGNVPARVRLDVTDTGSSPAYTSTTVNRVNPDGKLVPVRTFDGNPLQLTTSGSNRVGLLYDYEMPYGAAVAYTTTQTPGSVSASVTVAADKVWLIHPGVPSLSMPLTVASWGARTRKVARGVFYPMGRSAPVVQTDGTRRAAEYDLSVLTLTDDEYDKLDALIADAGTLLLNVPATKGWSRPTEYISVGDITETPLSRLSNELGRTWQLPCTVVDMPIGGSQSQRTYADLLTFATYADLRNAYPTYAALLAGP